MNERFILQYYYEDSYYNIKSCLIFTQLAPGGENTVVKNADIAATQHIT
jgi:hypothetical protein